MTSQAERLRRRTREPMRDLAAVLRALIYQGTWQEGQRLPTAREIATRYDVSLTTAVRAVGVLRDEGLVITTHGQGSHVTARQEIPRGDASRYARENPDGLSPNRDEATSAGFYDEIISTDRWTTTATRALAERLSVPEGADLSAVRYLFAVGGVPTQLATQWEPLDITRGTSAEIPASGDRGQPATHARFAAIGWRVSRVEEEYRARAAHREEVGVLDLPTAISILDIDRRTYARNAATGATRIIQVTSIAARGDRVVIQSATDVPLPQAVDTEGYR